MILALGLFLCVLLGTHGFNTQHSIEPQADFDLEKNTKEDLLKNVANQTTWDPIDFRCEWYRLGVADESNTFAMLKHHLKVSKGLLVADASGNVNLTMWTMRPNGCSISVNSYEKTDVPGAFTYFSKRHKIIKDITMVETNYTDYSLVLKYKSMDKEYTQIALYARTPTPTLEVIQKFISFALTLGFSEGAIMVPADIDHCPNLESRSTAEFREEKSAQTTNQSIFGTVSNV